MDSKIKICILLLITSTSSLKVFHSTLPMSRNTGVSGLKYINENNNDINFDSGLTVCARFNYKKLGGNAWLFDFDKSNDSKSFLWFRIMYPATWFGFGRFGDGTGYYSSWALQDPKTKNYNIWYTNRWHHVCIAYDAKKSHIAVIKVSILCIWNPSLKVNFS